MEIVPTIRSAGYRATPQRQTLLTILAERNSFDAETLRGLFIERAYANPTTFYRVIADFRAIGLVHLLYEEDGKECYSLCEEVRQGRKPSHFYELTHCHGCGNIRDHHLPVSSEGILSSKQEIHIGHCGTCCSEWKTNS